MKVVVLSILICMKRTKAEHLLSRISKSRWGVKANVFKNLINRRDS